MGIPVFAPGANLLAALTLLAAVSWLDDRHSLSVRVRLACQFVAAGLALAGWPAFGWLGSAVALLAIVWAINLYNFMDGANGLAGGMTVFGFGAYASVAMMAGQPALAVLAGCISAAAAGFLIFNFDPARIFMGDVGSVPLGFLSAVLGLEGLRLGAWPLWFPVLVFSPFIVDASATLAKRAFRGEKVWQAHREHCYQRLVRSGWSHRRLALTEYGLMMAVGASAHAMLTWPFRAQMIGLATWLWFMLRSL